MLILHGSNGSPFVSRVRTQLYAKELPFELVPAAPATPEFQRLNPLGKMPLLEHDGLLVQESLVILEYIEDAFPTPSLLGQSPEERMRVRRVVRTVDVYCGSVLEILRAAADPTHKIDLEAKRAEMNRGLGGLEAFLAGESFAAADRLSLADCTLIPWLYYANKLTDSGDDTLTRREKLSRYIAFIAKQPVTQRVWGEMDESFRAFMARWKAQQAAATKSD